MINKYITINDFKRLSGTVFYKSLKKQNYQQMKTLILLNNIRLKMKQK